MSSVSVNGMSLFTLSVKCSQYFHVIVSSMSTKSINDINCSPIFVVNFQLIDIFLHVIPCQIFVGTCALYFQNHQLDFTTYVGHVFS
jgi:hypothetical protein